MAICRYVSNTVNTQPHKPISHFRVTSNSYIYSHPIDRMHTAISNVTIEQRSLIHAMAII